MVERCCEMDTNVPTDVDVFHLLATLAIIINNVEVLEVSTDVICEIDAMSWVTACCSPVSGVSLQGSDSCQTQAVEVPVLGILIHWSVGVKDPLESAKFAICITPRHDQGPSRSGL